MKPRRFAWSGWLVLAVCVAGIVASLMIFASLNAPPDSVALEMAFLAFPIVGAVIVSQRPTNMVGWLFCLAGLGTATTSFSAAYVQFAIVHHLDGQPATGLIDLAGSLVWPANLTLGMLLLYLFPDGRPLSPRWRVVVWALVVNLLFILVGQAVAPGPLETGGLIPNPLGVHALAGASAFLLNYAVWPLPAFVLLAVASLILRYHRAAASQRQRIKWFVFGAAVMVIIVTMGIVSSSLISSDPNDLIATEVGNILFALGILALPIGAGVGVLRYRLYDIDILIKRTLVYGSLTAILAALYFALVIGAQTLTHRLTGQQAQQPVVIVLSTLLIAALFQPLRRRLQRTIDRRFDSSH